MFRRIPRVFSRLVDIFSFRDSRRSVKSNEEKVLQSTAKHTSTEVSHSSSISDSSNSSSTSPADAIRPVESLESHPHKLTDTTTESQRSLPNMQHAHLDASGVSTGPSSPTTSLETDSGDEMSSALFLGNIYRESGLPYTGGATADIYIGNYGESKVALKAMRIFAPEKEQDVIFKECFEEAVTWKGLHHKHILPFLGISRDSLDHRVCLVTPFMEKGNIKDYIQHSQMLNPLELMSQVADGLKFLHSKLIMHGDIKAANILINDDGEACLSDTGLAAISKTDGFISSRHMSINSTVRWMAPELYDEKPILTCYSDIYAFGMTLYEILSGDIPFHKHREFAVINMVLKGERPPHPKEDSTFLIDDAVWQLIESCWEHAPMDRCPIDQLLFRLHKLSALFSTRTRL